MVADGLGVVCPPGEPGGWAGEGFAGAKVPLRSGCWWWSGFRWVSGGGGLYEAFVAEFDDLLSDSLGGVFDPAGVVGVFGVSPGEEGVAV